MPTVEWLFHKTADDSHPSGPEQQMLWLMNRARANPAQEGVWLADTDTPGIAFPRTCFGVDLYRLKREFSGYAARPPAAFDARLYAAALAHSRDLVASRAQFHAGQLSRVAATSFRWLACRGNVFAHASDPESAHGAFAIDWGRGSPDEKDGMQAGRGHRKAVLSLDGDYTSVGIALVAQNDAGTGVGPFVITENFCSADTSVPDHFNRFIVGTVWRDLDGDGRYAAGEGIGGTTVTPDAGRYYAVTGEGGGYAIPVTAAGTYRVTFSGAVRGAGSVVVGDASVLLDLAVGAPSPRD